MDLKLSLIQTDLCWENKKANLDMLSQKIDSIQEHTQLILLPEMFSTGFSMQPAQLAETMQGDTMQWLQDTALRKKVVLAGSFMVQEDGNYYNRLVCMLPNGQFGHYDKRHLFSFGGEEKVFTPGAKRLIASVNGWRINFQVCYDLRFPVWARQQAAQKQNETLPEYDLLVNVANWPERRSRAWQTLLTARAIENQCYVAGVNRVGNDGNNVYHNGMSMLIDPAGEVLYQKADQEDVFTTTLSGEHLAAVREKFSFLQDADDFTITV